MMYLGKDAVAIAIAKETAVQAQFIQGTFTVPDSGSNYTLDFGKTFSKYLFVIEMTDASKTSLVNLDVNANRLFAFIGVYPKRTINNITVDYDMLVERYKPATGEISSAYANLFTKSSISIVFNTSSVSGSTVNALYNGCTYNYYIVEIK